MINKFFNRKYQFLTNKSIEDVTMSLKYRIDWKDKLGNFSLRNKYTVKNFEGYVEGRSFTIRRFLKSGANFFIPLVKGKVRRGFHGKNILEAKISFPSFAKFFYRF